MIKSSRLARLSGVSQSKISDWRRSGLIPDADAIPLWWVQVVRDVAAARRPLTVLFEEAKGRHRKPAK
jgi:hypothetical protein